MKGKEAKKSGGGCKTTSGIRPLLLLDVKLSAKSESSLWVCINKQAAISNTESKELYWIFCPLLMLTRENSKLVAGFW